MGDETSDCETNDDNLCDDSLIGKILGQMKSEFNKKDKKVDGEQVIVLVEETEMTETEPPVLTIEEQVSALVENDNDSTPPNIIKTESPEDPEALSNESKSTDEIYSTLCDNETPPLETEVTENETPIKKVENGIEDTEKPRIVLTFRTEKSKPTVTKIFKEEKSEKPATGDNFLSPGRRSLRIKNTPEEKDLKSEEPELKRSARRRSKDCNESVLQSAIARKEKSYNETAKPQRLTRRLKPTAKILENLAMCQKSAMQKVPSVKTSEEKEKVKKHKRKHNKSPKYNNSKKNKVDKVAPIENSNSGGSESEHSALEEVPEAKPLDAVKLEQVKPIGKPSKMCLCTQHTKLYISASNGDMVYCTAVDNISGRLIGCNNVVEGKEIALLRPSTRVPYIILCKVHHERMLRHNCCATCGLFCTQGTFVQCQSNHHYHRDCQAKTGDVDCCPHCGIPSPDYDVNITMHSEKKPVFLPVQKIHTQSAKMTFQALKERSPSPPLVPPNAMEIEVDPDSDKELELDMDCLFEAVKSSDYKALATILSNQNLKLNSAFDNGATILHYAAQEGLLAAAHMLVVAGAEIDIFDKEQNTPLMLAIVAHQNEMVRYLIKAGTSLSMKGTDGMTALHLASKSGNLEACQLLLAASMDIINLADDGGWTALVWACEHSHLEVAQFLLRKGADALLRDVEQNVALHWAAFSGNSEIMQLLINHGCDVNSINAHGDSPLHIGARQDMYNCVLLLLARGVHVNVVNKSGETPLECCSGDCYNAILLNVHLQNSPYDAKIILSNDISNGKEANPVQVINIHDDEEKPTDFIYVTQNCITSDIEVDQKITSLQSCECEDRCTSSGCLCTNNSLKCWYDEEGKLSRDFNFADPPMIFECNQACACNAITCNNRVVQHGLTQRFQLFRTETKGWGVRTLRKIPQGAYVCEYVGEILTDLSADQREDDSYLFDLDNRVSKDRKEGESYCIDARRYGNFARFINHSCDPNLLPVRVFIDHQDLRFPRIAFFANRDLQADEELGFDYGEKFWIIKYKSFTCNCESTLCKYSEETIQSTLENYKLRLQEDTAL